MTSKLDTTKHVALLGVQSFQRRAAMSRKDDQASFDRFCADLACMLGLDVAKAVLLAERLDERMNELADKAASTALDRENNRGNYARD